MGSPSSSRYVSMGSPFMISARAHSSHQYWNSVLTGSMSLTMGVPLPHQSHFRLCAPIRSAPTVAAGRAREGTVVRASEGAGCGGNGGGRAMERRGPKERARDPYAARRHRAPSRSVRRPSDAPILPRRRKEVSPTNAPPSAFVLKEAHGDGPRTCDDSAGTPLRPLSQAGHGSWGTTGARHRLDSGSPQKKIPPPAGDGILTVELRRIELLTSCMPCRRSTN